MHASGGAARGTPMTTTKAIRRVHPGLRAVAISLTALLLTAGAADAADTVVARRTLADVLAASTDSDWRAPDPAQTLYVQLASGRVVIELAPAFAPQHAENIVKLVREGYFDGLAIIRSQDNFVVQWGDAEGKRPIKTAKTTLPPEFTRPGAATLPFTRLPDADGYAPEVGFSGGLPVGRDPKTGEAWLAH